MSKVPDITHDIYGKEIAFDGNTNLKRFGTVIQYSKEHIEEYVKCKNDWLYFAQEYYYILSLEEGMIHPKIRDYQIEMINSYIKNRFTIVLASRQCLSRESTVTIKHKLSNEIKILSMKELHSLINSEKTMNVELYDIFTDSGWRNFNGITKYDPQPVIQIKTENGLMLRGSFDHSIFTEGMIETSLDDLFIGQRIYTVDGYKTVISKNYDQVPEELYDILDVEGETYFSNSIKNHNCGKSTSFEIFLCWTIIFNSDQRVAILANKAESSRDILRKVKEAYELLPHWLTQGIKTWNAGSIKLENGSMVIASSTSSTAIRGKSIGLLIIDECAFVEPENQWNAFISSTYPTVSSAKNSKVIFISTPNSYNHFYKDWVDANEGRNKFHPIRVDWWQIPNRDEVWKEETIANIGKKRFDVEYGNSFSESTGALIDAKAQANLKFKPEIESPKIYQKLSPHIQKYVKIYEEPIKGHTYVLGVDSSKMTEENSGDSLGMQILDVTNFPLRQVGVFYATEGISYLQTPDIAVQLGTYYNDAYLFIENNEVGQEISNMCLLDLEYENVFIEKGPLPGYRTTTKTKRIGCENLRLVVENNKIILNDYDTISQLSTYVKKKKSYQAESGYKDDLVAALLSALFFMQSKGLDIDIAEDNLTLVKNILAKTTEEQKAQEEEDAPATFFLDTGDDADLDDADWGNLNF